MANSKTIVLRAMHSGVEKKIYSHSNILYENPMCEGQGSLPSLSPLLAPNWITVGSGRSECGVDVYCASSEIMEDSFATDNTIHVADSLKQ